MKNKIVAIASFLAITAFAVSNQQVAYGQITSPTNNTFLIAGANQEISWSFSFDTTSIVVLQYTTNGGSSWNAIASMGIAAGSYNWVIPVGINSYRCKVRIVKFTRFGGIPLATTGNFSIATLDPTSYTNAVFSHRLIALSDTSGRHFNRVQFFK